MELVINGIKRELAAETVADVLRLLGLSGRPVMVEADGQVLKIEQWETTPVVPGMKLELVHFVAGG
ncbi:MULTISPECIES: sulfur carrier protein ThiS [Paenibacillus]|uniref:Thiamine biosynthesis protein ThiS n=1 Tax=Paenibacillus cineris TaxID=237530 RepID=A0ABQ4L7L0_9BACL|nr:MULTISPECIES: sulfur carrier protein ThiS [Paenibacillus]UYO04441.1 sulfur carrier protein ThiS [Paenibacillus sp. PSB04]GIO52260.1 hypothetical protein J21TS7_05780 [Paenibacillus cineris]